MSKIPRLVDYVSRKLSVQENITHDIGDILTDILNPKGVAVLVEGRHMCVEMRGVKKVNSITKTSYFLGEFKENNEKRMEFHQLEYMQHELSQKMVTYDAHTLNKKEYL